ncbi:MAG: formyltetrahydrofolate deformylase [Variovorax sp.]
MDAFAPGRHILTASCDSRVGTVAALSGFLADRRCNIRELQQFDDVLTERFYFRCAFDADPARTPALDALREQFEPVARSQDMQWALHGPKQRSRVAIMVSRADHCLEDLLYRRRTGELDIDITMVVSNHVDLQERVERERIAFVHLPVTSINKAAQEQELLRQIEASQTDLLVLARYMQILSNDLCRALAGRAINIHHSFLPGFKGARPYHQAHARGVKLIGATAHYVTADLDEGPIIEQVVERVDHAYTPDLLAAIGRDSERLALSRAVRFHVEHRVFLDGDRTVVFR